MERPSLLLTSEEYLSRSIGSWIRRDVAGEGRRGARGNRDPYALTRSECLGERHHLPAGEG